MTGPKKNEATIVVGLRWDITDLEGIRASLSAMAGVTSVELNYLTCKVTVQYDGTETTLAEVNRILSTKSRRPLE